MIQPLDKISLPCLTGWWWCEQFVRHDVSLTSREAIQLEIRTLQVPLNLLIYACLKKLSQDLTFSIISFISNILNFWENAACLFPSMHILSLRLWMWVIQVTFTDLCIYLSVGLWLLWWKWFCHIYKSKKKQGFKQTIPYKTCPYSGTLKHITN